MGMRGFRGLLVMLTVAVAGAASAAVAQPRPPELAQTQGFRKAVTVAGIRQHQRAFQDIADANGGNRVSGTAGYDESAEYVADRMTAAGYDVSTQEFTFTFVGDQTPPVMEQVSPNPTTYVDGVDFATMQYSGSGDVTAPVSAVDLVVPSPAPNASTSGCEAADFAGFTTGNIALMQRGTCTFRAKVENAVAAGAAAAVIFNEGNAGRTGIIIGTLSPPPVALPAVGTTFAVGDDLRDGVLNGPTGVTLHLKTDVIAEDRTTTNVIAETPGGDPDSVVVVGAHLDSVSRGPGMNDDGSGSAAILEIAEVYGSQVDREPLNKLRFIWFGAEEFGLLGSEFYAHGLSEAELEDIRLYLNMDMLGSPNFVRFVFDGDNSAGGNTLALPAGSGAIEQLFLDYFSGVGLATDPTAVGSNTDHVAFAEEGIPIGGLFSGAGGAKTAAQAATYGGTAGEPYDPCNHLACDDFDNVSLTVLDQLSDGAAHAVLLFSQRKFESDPLT
jgi:Zn-dependent M28 family amino/carboxypeptidase